MGGEAASQTPSMGGFYGRATWEGNVGGLFGRGGS